MRNFDDDIHGGTVKQLKVGEYKGQTPFPIHSFCPILLFVKLTQTRGGDDEQAKN
jgi:hypothetical protein